MDVKNVNVILKLPVDNIFPWFASLLTIEIASKRSKLCIEITRLRLLVPLQLSTFRDILTLFDKSKDHGKLLSIC